MELVLVSTFVVVGALAVAVLLRDRGVALVSGASWLVFLALALVVLSAVLVPRPYEEAADALLDHAGLRDRIARLDRTIPVDAMTEIAEDPEGALGGVLRDVVRERFGVDIGGAEEREAVRPTGDSEYFETAIYDPLVAAVALILRGAAFVAGLSGMCVALALSYAAGALGRLRAVAATVNDLDGRIARLEAARGDG